MPNRRCSPRPDRSAARRLAVGVVDYVHPNYAYVVVQEDVPDIWVKHEDLMGALDKDTVQVELQPQRRGDGRTKGKVVAIVERSTAPIVGLLQCHGKAAFVIPDGRRMHYDIFVQPRGRRGAQDGDKVVVAITGWPNGQKNPTGVVKRVLGRAGLHEVEMHAIMEEFGLPTHFPRKVLAEANAMDTTASDAEVARRRDLRSVPTFTIDPDDAKDFDDALSLQELPDGRYEVGIHIADVSHYVAAGTLLDHEAFERGTSVYLVDRTIPMLPEKLCNVVCSLRPHEDKLAFSAMFVLDAQGTVHQQWFGETVIHSDRRFTYEEAQQVMDQQAGDFCQELTLLNQLARQLHQTRSQRGAISFETAEVKFRLDAQGKPLQVVTKVRKDAHKLVEEWMLLANERVAMRMAEGGAKPFVYRTHDSPAPEKLADFLLFAKQLGYEAATKGKQSAARALNMIGAAAEGTAAAHIVQSLAIRTMAKAVYTTEAKPHFGLAFRHYTHFTSPIRRYPDVMVHRLLKLYLQQAQPPDQAAAYEQKCQHASERERVAASAERASVRYKQVELLQTLQGQTLEGIISSITDWGIYVELALHQCEGMVRLADLQDDYYEVDERGFSIVGKQTKRTLRLGDLIRVRIKACDLTRRTVDLTLV